ncbi:hypothetical protein [Tenacibaculum sp. nBUS_03]|uniref:hypothetical protein n=1 Tax=Tenacibaculum sp. nBUS_03 TaxID=3395320 RepID=UPI003EB9FB6A
MRILILICISLTLKGCSINKDVYDSNGIKVYPKKTLDNFNNAKLTLLTKDTSVKLGKNNFTFEVDSYTLKKQTSESNSNHLANSHKGQHIHFIINNGPYQAKYSKTFEANFNTNSNIVLAFLSRSFHESIKEDGAYVLKQYQFNNEISPINIEKDPLLFYSRPKGTYQIEKGDKILLDFYLINTKLDRNGNKVKITLNDHQFIVDKWQPYIIEGLQKGEHKIQIELIDYKGASVGSLFNNSGVRKFNIK